MNRLLAAVVSASTISAVYAQGPTWKPRAPSGEARVYRLETTGHTQLTYGAFAQRFATDAVQSPPADMATRTHAFEITADLHTRVLEHSASVRTVAMRLSNLKYVLDGTADAPSQFYAAPFLIDVLDSGAIKDFRFAAGMPRGVAGEIRSLIEGMQVVLPSDDAQAWTSSVTTSQEAATLAYEALPSKTPGLKTWKRVLVGSNRRDTIEGDEADRLALPTTVTRSSGTVSFANDGSGLQEIAYRDELQPKLQGEALGTRDIQFHAVALPGVAASGLPSSVADAKHALADSHLARATFYLVPSSGRAQVTGLTAATAFDRFLTLVDQRASDGVFLLKSFVRLNPAMAHEIALRLNTLPSSEHNLKVVGFGFAALGAAGHTEAQAAIAEVLLGSTFQPWVRDRAARSTLSVPMPEPTLVKAMWSYRQGLSRSEKGWRTRLSIVTNLYGALGGVEHEVRENTLEVTRTLVAELHAASSAPQQLLALTALANVGDLSLVMPAVEPFFKSADPTLRHRAFHAYQKVSGDAAFNDFATRYSQEADPRVRRLASSVAETMPRSAARNDWAIAQVKLDQDEDVRGRLARIIGDGIKRYPGNADVLHGLLEHEHDPEVRSTIYRYVSPGVKTGGAP